MTILRIVLTVIMIIISIIMTVIILMQEGKNQGLGALAGQNDTYWGKNKKHSREARIQRATAILGALFIIVAALLSSKWV